METIKIMGTDDTPTVILDAENDIFEISGRSLPEDVTAFYDPILIGSMNMPLIPIPKLSSLSNWYISIPPVQNYSSTY